MTKSWLTRRATTTADAIAALEAEAKVANSSSSSNIGSGTDKCYRARGFDATAMPVPHRHAPDVKKRIGNANSRTYDEASASSTVLLRSKVENVKGRRLVARY